MLTITVVHYMVFLLHCSSFNIKRIYLKSYGINWAITTCFTSQRSILANAKLLRIVCEIEQYHIFQLTTLIEHTPGNHQNTLIEHSVQCSTCSVSHITEDLGWLHDLIIKTALQLKEVIYIVTARHLWTRHSNKWSSKVITILKQDHMYKVE